MKINAIAPNDQNSGKGGVHLMDSFLSSSFILFPMFTEIRCLHLYRVELGRTDIEKRPRNGGRAGNRYTVSEECRLWRELACQCIRTGSTCGLSQARRGAGEKNLRTAGLWAAGMAYAGFFRMRFGFRHRNREGGESSFRLIRYTYIVTNSVGSFFCFVMLSEINYS